METKTILVEERHLIVAYDDGRFEGVRAMLPLSVRFKWLGMA